MSRERNDLLRYVEESLDELREKRTWLAEADAISFVRATDRDWLLFGHLTPRDWLMIDCFDEPGFVDEEDECEWDDGYDDLYWDEDDDEYFDSDSYENDWLRDLHEEEPSYDVFAGRRYPYRDVKEARSYLCS